MLTEPLIIALIVGATGFSSSVGLWQYIGSRAKKPIDEATAMAAVAAQTQGMTLALVEQLQEEMAAMRTDHAATRKTLDRLQHALRSHQEQWESWYRRLMLEWASVRLLATPPAPPTFQDDTPSWGETPDT